MKIKIKKLTDEAVIPKKSHSSDAGFDLTATSVRIDSKGFCEIGTSIAIEIPENHVGLLFPRSSISKINMQLCNAVGVLDSSYRGEIKFRFKPSTSGKGSYNVGDRIGQLIIMPFPEVEFEEVTELDETDRGSGAFGSSNV